MPPWIGAPPHIWCFPRANFFSRRVKSNASRIEVILANTGHFLVEYHEYRESDPFQPLGKRADWWSEVGDFISRGIAGRSEEAMKALESDRCGGDHHRQEVPRPEVPRLSEQLLHLCDRLFQCGSVDGGDLYPVNRS